MDIECFLIKCAFIHGFLVSVTLNSNIFVNLSCELSYKLDMIQVMLVKPPLKMNLHVTGNWLQACFLLLI